MELDYKRIVVAFLNALRRCYINDSVPRGAYAKRLLIVILRM